MENTEDKKICVFGDSIAYGYSDIGNCGWVDRIKIDLGYKDFTQIFNLGISGNDSNSVVKRFDAEVAARRHHIIIFAIGINDCKYLEDKGDVNIPIEKHRENMTGLITKAKKLAEKVIVVGITPVEEEKVSPTPWNTNKIFKNSGIEEYNQTLQDICEQEKIDFVDIYGEFMKQSDYKELLHDGLHPNSKGHEIIFSLVNDLVKKYL